MAPPPQAQSFLANALKRICGRIIRLVYRFDLRGLENVPVHGPALLLSNHTTWVDAVLLQVVCPRPIRFLIFNTIYKNPLLNPALRLFGAIPISGGRAKDGLRAAIECLQAGEVVCLFPEGALTRTGTLLRIKKGFEIIARKGNAPVVPVWLDQLWGSLFSFEGGRFFRKLPRRLPYPVTVAFGSAIPPEDADDARVRERLLELSAICYNLRPAFGGHLGEACVRGLKRGQFGIAVTDGMDGSSLTRGTLLAAAIALASTLRKVAQGRRIGFVLPPSKGAVLANLAILFAGKVPVGLNFTAGRHAIEAALRRGEIDAVITARIVERKLENFPWPKNVLYLDELVPPLKKRIAFWRAVVAVAPARLLARLIGIPRRGGHEEAVLLFTSGSSGEPKGVVLSHHNLLANISQFRVMVNLHRDEALMASLPFFHSFGCTVTLWFPMLEGLRAVTYPSPLEVAKNAELIERYQCSLLLATPTFLRTYLRKAAPEQLRSVRLTVTGSEKLPRELATAFEERFGKQVMEGYGLTETSPVVSVNLPDVVVGEDGRDTQPAYRPGSVGKLAPGLAVQIRDAETDAPKSLYETGMVWFKGPNIFEGYLDEPERTAAVIQDGWFRSGDLGRCDEDGFLYIEGRLSRFSKIGGEMVPHELLEEKIHEALETPKGERQVVVVGIPDEAKGEALILLTTVDIDLTNLRSKLSAAGVANLWMPRVVKGLGSIPVLGSGKLDLGRCQELAKEL